MMIVEDVDLKKYKTWSNEIRKNSFWPFFVKNYETSITNAELLFSVQFSISLVAYSHVENLFKVVLHYSKIGQK